MPKKDTFFVTTPIYYTNGIPHIGHAYSSIIADTIARYQRINGKEIKFSTGVDENSQKALEKAQEQDMEIMPYLDMMAAEHRAVWDGLKIKYTDFIRTTEARHHKLVREVLQKSFDNGDIYEGIYEGMYCVGCEAFKKDEDLVYMNKTTRETFPITDKVKPSENIIKVCPIHLTEPQILKEKNYFFKLSEYQDKLLKFYEDNPKFVTPKDRFNEVKAFVERGLDDFSISRETNKFGIKLPFDETQVTYVWYDALFNYLTVCKESDKGNDDMEFWPADLHVVAKDIIRFHAIYWPAMLMSAGYDLPKQILTTGFLTINGQKISKSLGNVINPVEFSAKYSKDLLVLYLLSSFNIGQDGDFDEKQAILQYNAKLANNFGNLLNRAVVLSLKIPHPLIPLSQVEGIEDYIKAFDIAFENYDLKIAIDKTFSFLDEVNLLITKTEPWNLIKDETKLETVQAILYITLEIIRQVALNLYIFFPEKMGEVFKALNLNDYEDRLKNGELQALRDEKVTFEIKEKAPILFEKFEI